MHSLNSPLSPKLHSLNTSDDEALGDALLRAQQQRTDSWTVVSNLDRFFQKVYEFYLEKSWRCLIINRVVNLLTLAFTIGFSTFLLLFVNWTEVLKCQSADSCASVKPLRPDALLQASFGDVIVFLYFLIFSLYWVWNLFSSLYAIRDGWEMRAFFQDQLLISEERLATMEWSAVVDTIVALQRTLRLCVVKDLNALDIANRIMRSENYMIALVNKRLLDLRIPWADILRAPFVCCCCRSSTTSMSEDESPSDRSQTAADALAAIRRLEANADEDPADQDEKDDEADGGGWCRSLLPRRVVLTRLLDWNVRFCVLNSMFDQEFVVRPAFLMDAAGLRRRFRYMAVANFVLMPFILIFTVIFFFLQHAQEFHEKKSYLGPRQWSPLALWQLREFNELPHFFSQRLAACEKDADLFISRFPARAQSLIARFVGYVAGAIVAVLLALTLVDSQLLVNLSLGGRPLFWYLAVFSGVLAAARSLTSDDDHQHVSLVDAATALAAVVRRTHYLPARWKANIRAARVRSEFSALYAPKVMVFAHELLGVLTAPFVLGFSLPASAERIIEFVRAFTVNVPGVGDVCGFANFDFVQFGDEAYQPPVASDSDEHMAASAISDFPDDLGESTMAATTMFPAASSSSSQHSIMSSTMNLNAPQRSQLLSASTMAATQIERRADRDANLGGSSFFAAGQSPRTKAASNQGKMEKSFLSFALNNPKWSSPHSAASQLLASVVQLPQIPEDRLAAEGNETFGTSASLAQSTLRQRTQRGAMDWPSPEADSPTSHDQQPTLAVARMRQTGMQQQQQQQLQPSLSHMRYAAPTLRPPPASRADAHAELFLSLEDLHQCRASPLTISMTASIARHQQASSSSSSGAARGAMADSRHLHASHSSSSSSSNDGGLADMLTGIPAYLLVSSVMLAPPTAASSGAQSSSNLQFDGTRHSNDSPLSIVAGTYSPPALPPPASESVATAYDARTGRSLASASTMSQSMFAAEMAALDRKLDDV